MSTQPTLSIPEARAQLAPADFRLALRRTLLDNPALKLQEVATQLGVSRQAVGAMVGRLDRPTCAHPNRPAPKREAAKMKLADLSKRVAAGESPRAAADGLGISLAAAAKLGWRAKDVRPASRQRPHRLQLLALPPGYRCHHSARAARGPSDGCSGARLVGMDRPRFWIAAYSGGDRRSRWGWPAGCQ